MNNKKTRREFLLSLLEDKNEIEINNYWLVKLFSKQHETHNFWYVSVFTQEEYKQYKEKYNK